MSVAVSQMTRERACLSSAFFLTSGDSTLTPLVLVLMLAVQWTVMEANQIQWVLFVLTLVVKTVITLSKKWEYSCTKQLGWAATVKTCCHTVRTSSGCWISHVFFFFFLSNIPKDKFQNHSQLSRPWLPHFLLLLHLVFSTNFIS